MSRNLASSSCVECGYVVRLSDLRDKPIEFRRYFTERPVLGCRFDCACGEVYFAIWRGEWDSQFVIDLSYYATYNDEKPFDPGVNDAILAGQEPPWHLCLDDAEDQQAIW